MYNRVIGAKIKDMDNHTLGGYNSIDAFVKAKLNRYSESKRDFAALFELMFSEGENIIFEESRGYRIAKTTYAQAKQDILRKAVTLKNMLGGVQPNSAVGIYMENSLEWIEIFWAVLRAGFRPLLMNMRLDDGTLEYALNTCEAAAVISDEREFSVRTIKASDVALADGEIDGGEFGTEIFVMSSGTSENVKICAYTAGEFYWQIKGSYSIIQKCAKIKEHYDGELKLLTFLPFYHIFGLVAVYIWFAFFSRTFVRLNDMQPSTITNTIKRHKVTHVFAVPLFWEKVYEQAVRTIKERGEDTYKKFEKGMRLSRKIGDAPLLGEKFSQLAFKEVRENMFGESVRFMITGGSYIKPEIMEFFNAIGYRLADGYGMTEIGITSLELSGSKKLLNSCSVGLPMDGIEYKINDSGELLVKGRAMARYIIENGEKKPNDGWFNTHDLAEFDGRCYRILGRRDDLIIAPNGENLNPNLIEQKLICPGVRGVCLIGAEEDSRTVPTLIVSVNKYISAERLEQIKSDTRQRLADSRLAGQIQRLFFTDESLLKGDEIKLNRVRISNEYKAKTLREVRPDESEELKEDDEISRNITRMFAVALGKPESEIGYTADFFLDEGGTSLDYLAIISQLRDEYKIPFPEGDSSLNSVKGLHLYIKEKLSNAD